MIKLWLDTTSLTIATNRIVTFDSPSWIEPSVNYSVVGTPIINGVQFEAKYSWQGIECLLTQSELNTLNYLKLESESLRINGGAFNLGFENTVFPITETVRTRAIATDTEETENEDDTITYYPQYSVMLLNIKSRILGDWRQTSFDLIELNKVLIVP
jgi:hypothetical protein